jgi:DNA mismatch repair protein MutS2
VREGWNPLGFASTSALRKTERAAEAEAERREEEDDGPDEGDRLIAVPVVGTRRETGFGRFPVRLLSTTFATTRVPGNTAISDPIQQHAVERPAVPAPSARAEHAHGVLDLDAALSAIAPHARSAPARDRLLARRPCRRLEEALERQEILADLLALVAGDDAPPWETPPDLRGLLPRLRTEGATLRGEELWSIRELLDRTVAVVDWRRMRREQDAPALGRLLGALDPLAPLHRELGAALDPSGAVRDEATPDLGRIRRSIRTIRDRLSARLEALLRALKAPESFVTLRDGRYAIAVPASHRREVPGTTLGHSGSGATLFVEPREAAEANSELSELALDEVREVERVLRALTARAARDREALERNLDGLVELDAAHAVVSWARGAGAMLPLLTSERRLALHAARHPLLLERARRGEMPAPVPLDLELGEEGRMLLVTGPNMGGKTVALKTTGLLALLAMSGFPVPAASGTTIPWFDRVICDVGDEQSVMADVSTFLSHLRRVSEAVSGATPESLVLLDELGSGTDPTEGAALGQAVLERLLERGCLTLATTHHGALKAFAQEAVGVRNASMAFDEETHRPLFTLLVGVPGRSRALQVAARFGMDPVVLRRAEALLPQGERDLGALLEELGRLRAEVVTEREALASTRGRLAERESELGEMQRRLESERRERKQAELAARRDLLRQLETQIDEYRRRLRADRKASPATLEEARGFARRVSDAIDAETEAPAAPERGVAADTLRSGERIYVPSLQAEGVALSDPDGDGRVRVRIGAATAVLPLGQLRRLGEGTTPPASARGPVVSAGTRELPDVKNEIDVRGCDAQEAIEAVERFLEDAHMGGIERARIIHGKGTGVLRERIREWLKKNQLVKEFRLGEIQEGGTGVTIVTLA